MSDHTRSDVVAWRFFASAALLVLLQPLLPGRVFSAVASLLLALAVGWGTRHFHREGSLGLFSVACGVAALAIAIVTSTTAGLLLGGWALCCAAIDTTRKRRWKLLAAVGALSLVFVTVALFLVVRFFVEMQAVRVRHEAGKAKAAAAAAPTEAAVTTTTQDVPEHEAEEPNFVVPPEIAEYCKEKWGHSVPAQRDCERWQLWAFQRIERRDASRSGFVELRLACFEKHPEDLVERDRCESEGLEALVQKELDASVLNEWAKETSSVSTTQSQPRQSADSVRIDPGRRVYHSLDCPAAGNLAVRTPRPVAVAQGYAPHTCVEASGGDGGTD